MGWVNSLSDGAGSQVPSVGTRATPRALENTIDLVASCISDRLVGIDDCWIEATQ
jgi:hypothetical protein